ncbi:hypothetical protein HZC30_00115 [Candidatus Woesearchaeota archaeon]|nr:hypothetical protein [Candidatus Woesearchaeota archaeon]
MFDELIKEVYEHMSFEEKEKIQAKIAQAKEEGLVFDSVADLVRTEYPAQEIIEKERSFYLVETSTERKVFVPSHYNCPICGVVKGSMRSEYSKSPPES